MQFMLIEFVSSSCFACSDMMIAVGPRSVVGRCSWTPRGSARRLWLAGGSGCAGATRRGGDDDGELADVTYRAVAHADPPLLASSTSTTSKVVNDNLGHETDDAFLVAVAQRLTSCARAADTVARLGGDEFVIIFDGVGAAEAAYSAERIIAALAAPVVADGHELL